MKQTFIVIFISIWSFCFGQNFSQIYWGNLLPLGANPCFWMDQGDTLYSFSFMEGNFRLINFRSFNRNGLVIDSTGYEWDSSVYTVSIRSNSLKRVSKNKLVSLHDVYYTGDSSFTNLFLIKNNLDTIKTKEFRISDSTSTNVWDLWIDDSTITVLGHHVLQNNNLELYIAQYDTTLQLKWYKTIPDFRNIVNQYFNGYYPEKIILKDGYYYISGYAKYWNQFVEGFLVKTDLLGNLIWDQRYQYQNFDGGNEFVTDIGNDSLFMPYNYSSKIVGTVPYDKIQFRIIDTSGTVIKDSLYPEEEIVYLISNIQNSDDGNILITGNFYQGGMKSFIWKMDKNLNTLWRRVYYYGDWEDESWLYNIGQWSDGSVVSVGTYFDRYMNPTSKHVYLWLLSTDTNGCLSPSNCGSGILVEEWGFSSESLKIFPNPAKEFLHIELPKTEKFGQLKIFNSSGQLVIEKQRIEQESTIELHNYPEGMYVVEVKGKKTYRQKVMIVQ